MILFYLVIDNQKYLGETFDCRLNWSSHVSKICGNMSYNLMLINIHVKYLVRMQGFFTIHLCIACTGTSCLQCMQNRAVRLNCGLQKYDHVSQHRANFGWLSMLKFVQY